MGFSLVAVSGGYSPVVCGHLIAVASRHRARTLGTWTSVVVAHRFSCHLACGMFLDQRSNPCVMHWQVDFYPLSHQAGPRRVDP